MKGALLPKVGFILADFSSRYTTLAVEDSDLSNNYCKIVQCLTIVSEEAYALDPKKDEIRVATFLVVFYWYRKRCGSHEVHCT